VKILLLGSTGQLGQAWIDLSKTDAFPIGWTLVPADRHAFNLADLPDPAELTKRWSATERDHTPDLIINAAAYTAVDRAETERELCHRINAKAPGVIAQACARLQIPMVHYSSDYVYSGGSAPSGSGPEPHLETEPHAPLNEYGRSKALGDEAVLASGADALIFRTSWVYSHVGKNFVNTMLRLGGKSESVPEPRPEPRPEISVVADQVGAPTYAPDLAKLSLEALMRALEKKATGAPFPGGIYHLCNSGSTSWAAFARAILPGARIKEITTSEYPTPALRPKNSRLSLTKLENTFGLRPRSWQEALQDCLAAIKKQEKQECK
jgi:dTDP-4-dehydrorhamnose reductase